MKLTDIFGNLLEKAGGDPEQVRANIQGYTPTGETVGFGDSGAQIYKDQDGNEYIYLGKSGFKELAIGGTGYTNDMAMVGERGPELVRFGQMGEVINNRTTSDIMSAASGIVEAVSSNTNTTTAQPQNIVQPANMVDNNNISDDILKQISDILNTSNTIQSNILKETRQSKRFEY